MFVVRAMDLDAVAELTRRVVADVHLPMFDQGVPSEEKSPGEVVSRVDRDGERLLLEGLQELAPGVPMIGEEAASDDPSLLAALRRERPVWVVDPLDGTQHFLDGSPDWAIMVALVQRGQPLCAVVHQPKHAVTYMAELGGGTWRDGIRLRTVPQQGGEELADLRGGVLRRFLSQDARLAVEANESRFGDLTPKSSCAGIEYPRIIEGDADFLLFWRTLPWDHAAGSLLLTEAGGAALRPDGSAYRVDDNREGLLAATDAGTALRVLQGFGLASRKPVT